MKKIFVFCNQKNCDGSGDWHNMVAIAEDGTCLAGHVCSNHGWAWNDMGFTSDWKRDRYDKHYPDGWELEWVENTNLETHAGIQLAFERNRARRPELA